MANIQVKKASKLDAKLRLALCGPAGSGKSYSALLIAREMAGPNGRILANDTEHGSMSLYAGLPGIGDFDVVESDSFDPRNLIDFIDYAVREKYDVFICDSLSHYWAGVGGELEMVEAAQKRGQGNSFTAWKSVTPVHNQLVDKLIGSSIHTIITMRLKTAWVIEDGPNGKKTPRKVGLEAIMRDGIDYEMQVVGNLDQDNNLVVTKSRCPELAGKVINRPGAEMARTLKAWLHGAPAPAPPVPAAHPAASAPSAPTPQPPPAAAPPAKDTRFADMVAKFQEQKARIGEDSYRATLRKHGVESSNKFSNFDAARECYREMAAMPAKES